MKQNLAEINLDEAKTLAGLFQKRIEKTPNRVAYRHFDESAGGWVDTSWEQMGRETARWQAAFEQEGLRAGDHVGIMMPNRREWVMFDQATMGLGLISVPLFYNDRGGNVAYIADHAELKMLVIAGEEQWQSLEPVQGDLAGLPIISLEPLQGMEQNPQLRLASDWLPETEQPYKVRDDLDPQGMCTIVYTSGTTGQPKGVMLSHHNILSNTYEALQTTTSYEEDILLSFLPLSHMLERTGGYYLAMMAGVTVAYARSIPQLGEDLVAIRPTLMISVPRIYERVYARIQEGLEAKPPLARKLFKLAVDVGWKRFQHRYGRESWSPSLLLWPLLDKLVASKIIAKLGGRLRSAISGGAPMPAEISRVFLALGVPILQGYGLTETSPVLAVNRLEENLPESVGKALPSTELATGDENELLARGAAVMLGFWKNPEETARVIDEEGWFHTGDIARIDDEGNVFITGRIKDIVVLANGEKVSPADMEMAIAMDPLFEQVMVIGEGRPYLCALIVPEQEQWQLFAETLGLDPNSPESRIDARAMDEVRERINRQLHDFPGYAQIRQVMLLEEPWSVENGFLTPTMKTKRKKILDHCDSEVQRLYAGH